MLGAPPERTRTAPREALRRTLRRLDTLKHEIAKFGVVGATAYVVDSATFWASRVVVGEPLTAKVVAAVIGSTAAFLGNRYWTWRNRPRSGLTREYVRFALINVTGLGIQLVCLGASHYGLGALWPEPFRSVPADLISGNVVGMAFATVFRFWGYRAFVFREKIIR